LVVPSQYLYDVFQRLQAPCAIISNIIDLQRFPFRSPVRTAHGAHIIVTRNLERIYDLGTGIRAFALLRKQLPEARMTIAGSGPELSRLESLAVSLGVAGSVCFAGRIDNANIAELYQRADLLLNPSLVDNMPISLLEAFASGVPVVSTRVGGVPFIAQDGKTALLVSPEAPESMAHAMLRILTEPNLAATLATAARAEAEKYSWEHVKERWIAEYSRLMRTRSTTADCSGQGGAGSTRSEPR
jgi:glycosyltransferase involved in cell wall biosynthesis